MPTPKNKLTIDGKELVYSTVPSTGEERWIDFSDSKDFDGTTGYRWYDSAGNRMNYTKYQEADTQEYVPTAEEVGSYIQSRGYDPNLTRPMWGLRQMQEQGLQGVYPEFALLAGGRGLFNGALQNTYNAAQPYLTRTFQTMKPGSSFWMNPMTKGMLYGTAMSEGVNLASNLATNGQYDTFGQHLLGAANQGLDSAGVNWQIPQNVWTEMGAEMLNPGWWMNPDKGLTWIGNTGEKALNVGKQGIENTWNWAARQGNNYARARQLSRTFDNNVNSTTFNTEPDLTNSVNRVKLGDVEINNPGLAYRQGDAAMGADFLNTGVVRINENGYFKNPIFNQGSLFYGDPVSSPTFLKMSGEPKKGRFLLRKAKDRFPKSDLLVSTADMQVADHHAMPKSAMGTIENEEGDVLGKITSDELRRIPAENGTANKSNTSLYRWEPGYGYREVKIGDDLTYTLGSDLVDKGGNLKISVEDIINQIRQKHPYVLDPTELTNKGYKGPTDLVEHIEDVVKSAQEYPLPKGVSRKDYVTSALYHDLGKLYGSYGHGVNSNVIVNLMQWPTTRGIQDAVANHMQAQGYFDQAPKLSKALHAADVGRGKPYNQLVSEYPYLNYTELDWSPDNTHAYGGPLVAQANMFGSGSWLSSLTDRTKNKMQSLNQRLASASRNRPRWNTTGGAGYIPTQPLSSGIKLSPERIYNRIPGDQWYNVVNENRENNYGVSSVLDAVRGYLNNEDNYVEKRLQYYSPYKDISWKDKEEADKEFYKRARGIGYKFDKLSKKERSILQNLDDKATAPLVIAHEDAKDEYLGLPQRFGTLKKSEYYPTQGKLNNGKYITYMRDPSFVESILLPTYNDFKIGKKRPNNKKYLGEVFSLPSYTSNVVDITPKGNAVVHIPFLNNATMSSGYDDRGEYMSIYDTWDYNTKVYANPGDDIGQHISGKPFDIYDRYYLDDVYGVKTPTHATYLPEVEVVNNKAQGGSLNTHKQWQDLPIKERADIMKVAIRNGITNLADIKAKYNEFALGEQLEESNLYGGGGTKNLLSGAYQKLSRINQLQAAGMTPQEAHAMQYYVDRGFAPHQAAGFVGGFVRESALDPTALNKNSGAYGIGQWLGPRKDALMKMYGNNPTFANELDYSMYELDNTTKEAKRRILSSSTPEEAAANAFNYYGAALDGNGIANMNRWGQDGQKSLQQGIDNAKRLYNLYSSVGFSDGGNMYSKGSWLRKKTAAISKASKVPTISKKSTPMSNSSAYAMQYFINKGLAPHQAAGLVGNLMRESGLNPLAINPGSKAYGLAQWLGARKKKLFSMYGNKPTLQNQLDFVWWELNNTHKNGLKHLMAARNAEEAARAGMNWFEFSNGDAISEMNKWGQDGRGSMRKGIEFATKLAGQPMPDLAYLDTPNPTMQQPQTYGQMPMGYGYPIQQPQNDNDTLLAFEPSNPQAFFAPLSSYETPVEQPVTQPLVDAAEQQYKAEMAERQRAMQQNNNMLALVSYLNNSGNQDSSPFGVFNLLSGNQIEV